MGRGVGRCLWVVVAGCSDGSAEAGDATEMGATIATTLVQTGAPPTTGEEPRPDLGARDCGLGGELGLSFIWIANSTQGTLSKIDTNSLKERGRYVARPDVAGNPSRTSVSLTGDVVVANRNGGVTKIYALTERCAESNGTPGIQSATDAKFLAWGEEECVAWYTPMAYFSQRPVAWTPGEFDAETCSFSGQKVWTAGMNTPGTVDILRLDGDSGAIEAKVTVTDAYVDNYGIYGAAVDARGNFWGSQVGPAKLHFVDHATLEHRSWDMPVGGYGITVDSQGYVWTCAGNASRFDPMSETWTVVAAGEYGGCMEDGAGTLYKATPGGVLAFDTATMTVKRSYPLPQHAHGISVDFNGYVWAVTQGTEAYRLDPADGSFAVVGGLVGAYTYSDMTGFALSSVHVP